MSADEQWRYRQLLARLEGVEAGDFSSDVLGDLIHLFNLVEETDPLLDTDFSDRLTDLETDIAGAIDDAEKLNVVEPSFDAEAIKRMLTAAAQMKQMVLAYIKDPPPDESQAID